MSSPKVAILGATSHIAKNLIVGLSEDFQLFLFARSISKVNAFIKDENIRKIAGVWPVDSFGTDDQHYDAIINCIGFGTPDKLKNQEAEVFFITERYDNMILFYLQKNKSTLYVYFSSGAIYWSKNETSATSTEFRLELGSISLADAYPVSKLNAETKHRSLYNLSIIDLRVFSFFSRYIDLTSSFLLSDLINSVTNRLVFETDNTDIYRDYIHPFDLCDLIRRCLNLRSINRAFDAYSKQTTSKNEIIKMFQREYGLQIDIRDKVKNASPTGIKNMYIPRNLDAEAILGYSPQYRSIDVINEETQKLLHGAAQ